MSRRTATQGQYAGHPFWGCSGYPACRGTRKVGDESDKSDQSDRSDSSDESYLPDS